MDLVITEFKNRRNPVGRVTTLSWSALKNKLKNAVITNETVEEYSRMSNEDRTDIKDVGGFVGGELEGGKRSKSALLNRSVITIDADEAKPDDVEAFQLAHNFLFFTHTTHTSTASSPRLRWIFPLLRPVNADEYKKLALLLADMVGSDTIDETTDQPERLMFWPSVALDGDFQTWEGGDEAFDPDDYLDSYDFDSIEVAPKANPARTSEDSTPKETPDVYEGGRNKQLFGYASMLRGAGLDAEAMAFALNDYNDRYCHPPMPPAELDTIVRSVCGRYAQGDKVLDSLRDAWDDFSDMGVIVPRNKEHPKNKHLAIESAKALGLREIEPPKYIVEDLITTGISVLASPPKFGKSWLCTDLCQCIATGNPFLGLKTVKSKVIYLALEDGAYRLKDRGLKVSGGKPLPEDMFLAMEAPMLQDGLLHELALQIQSLENVGCIVIDTLQKIRGVAGKTEGVYGYDYRELGELHQFALDNNIAVVLVHHLNKGGDDSDFVSRLNGSTGLSGAADTIITMTRAARGDKNTKMAITGRDVKERTLILQMNWSTYKWECLGDEKDVTDAQEDSEYENDPIVRVIKDKLDAAEDLLEDTSYENDIVQWTCTSQELHDAIVQQFGPGAVNGSASVVGQKVRNLVDKLRIIDGITYDYVVSDTRREHKFIRYIV